MNKNKQFLSAIKNRKVKCSILRAAIEYVNPPEKYLATHTEESLKEKDKKEIALTKEHLSMFADFKDPRIAQRAAEIVVNNGARLADMDMLAITALGWRAKDEIFAESGTTNTV